MPPADPEMRSPVPAGEHGHRAVSQSKSINSAKVTTATRPQLQAGIFANAQPEYAALGIATFPFDATEEVKRGPLVSHYHRMGLLASREMTRRFPDAPGLANGRCPQPDNRD
jgi:hypothetical protein